MQKSVNALRGIFVSVVFLLAFARLLQAQDNPNVDNTVGIVPEGWAPPVHSIEVITSPEGFDNFDLGIDFAEPHMSSNPLNPLEYFNAFNTNRAHSTYDGLEWNTTTPPFPGFSMAGDPVTAYDSLGTLYYENMYTVGGNIVGCKTIVSADNGATWSAPVTSVDGVDKNWIACDQTAGPFANYAYTTMTAGGGNGNFARSTDFGATWQQTWTFGNQNLPGMMVAVGPDVMGGNNISGGCVYVVTNGGNAFSPAYTFYRSTDGGATFQVRSGQFFAGYVGTNVGGRHSVENMRTRPYPFITADNSFGPYRGRLYVIYASNTPAGNGNKPDIFCRYSDDQGLTWSGAAMINDDLNTTANHQWHPSTWCDKETGRLYVKWFDTRNVPTSDSAEVYASYSDDGGDTWVVNQNLSTAKFKIDCSTCGGGGTPRYQGDYDAITSNRYGAMAVWSDFRFGNFSSFVAYFPDYAMLLSTTSDSLLQTDSLEVYVKVPAVKLYEHGVKFTAEVSPAADINLSFPQGDSLSAYPDSVLLKIKLNDVPQGIYEVAVTGAGPNGTPVHKRTISLFASTPATTVLQPNGGEELYAGTVYNILWDKILVDSVKIEFSTDGGSTWIVITEGTAARPLNKIHPKQRALKMPGSGGTESAGGYSWIVPNTLSDNCLVRISDKNNPAVMDVSDAPFFIILPPQPVWKIQSTNTDSSLLSVSVFDTTSAWAGGLGGVVLRTANGGQNWLPVTGVVGGDVYNIEAITVTRALVAVNEPGSARIRRTFNTGITWVTVYENTDPGAFINAIHMFDENNGYAMGDPVGGQWTLLRTTDGGANWVSVATLAQDGSEIGFNNSMSWVGDQFGWFGTDNGRVYYTTDGGANWSHAATGFDNSFTVSFATEQFGMAAGDGADYSSDGGVTWVPAGASLPGAAFGGIGLNVDPHRWYFVSGNAVYKTADLGGSFSMDFSQVDALNHIDMAVVEVGVNPWIVGYAVGSQGTINKYTELITITGIGDKPGAIPAVFSLRQNYPNPFNPTTRIAYTLPAQAEVSLKIVNLLGQEVRTLITGSQNAGAHEVVWDGSNAAGIPVASGMYFYKLEARALDGKTYSDTRKMLLMK